MNILKTNGFLSRCTLLFCIVFFAGNTIAQNKVDFAGFATLAYSKTTHSTKEGSFYGMSTDGDARQLSLLGLRTNVAFEDYKLSFTAQAVISGNDDYKPKFDWIYATYDLGAGWSLSAGRTRTPLFMYSAYQDVSYAYTWLKTPFSVYGIPQFKSVDGIKVRHQGMMGDWSSDVQVWYGTINELLQENGLNSNLKLKDDVGIAWDVEHEWLRLHAAYMFADTSIDLTSNADLAGMLGLFDNLDAFFGAAGQTAVQTQIQGLKKQLQWESSKAHFASLGLGLDFGYIFLNTEATYINIGESVAAPKSMQSYYVTLGTRPFKDWTFSLTVTRDRDREHKGLSTDYSNVIDGQVVPALTSIYAPGSIYPAALQSAATDLNTAIAGYGLDGAGFAKQVNQLQHFDAQGLILSSRWDFHRSASAKLEYLAEERRYGGSKINRPQGVRIGVDVVF